MATLQIELELPEGTEFCSYERVDFGHAIEVSWPLPTRCACQRCQQEATAHIEYKPSVLTIRDLFIWEEPSFFVYQQAFHRCPQCGHRQDLVPPFKRKDAMYTYRFEELVLRMLIGSNEEDVARRLGISAETVAFIVKNQLAEVKPIDPQRVIEHIGMDELSLKKRHQLYATIMTDLTDPANPQVLAVVAGRDKAAGVECLSKLTEEQRKGILTYRVDMGKAYTAACALLLKQSREIIDRFHVAKLFNEKVDKLRKKITHHYKATLTKEELKEFKSLMWEFRRDPATLSLEENARLAKLFKVLPELEVLYHLRLRFQEIFDTAPDRETAASWLRELRADMSKSTLDFSAFWQTYDEWNTSILNYFDEHYTSATVEGINNKARVIIKRSYGIRSANTLWTRLILDLNLASLSIGKSIQDLKRLTAQIKANFLRYCA